MVTIRCIDLNADLGEGYGQWPMGDDTQMLKIVTSANIACGGHAGDPETMFATLTQARNNGVVVGAHPGYVDRMGFGRRIIPMSVAEVERMVATQIGALMGAAALAGVPVQYVKAHGALANLGSVDRNVAEAIVRATRAVSGDLAFLAISGTELETAGLAAGLQVFSEIFADRTYMADGRLVPRNHNGALIHDPSAAARRLIDFLADGMMPTLEGPPIQLVAQSICIHGDNPGAVEMARQIRTKLEESGISLAAFLPSR